jgi:hypothetical protein
MTIITGFISVVLIVAGIILRTKGKIKIGNRLIIYGVILLVLSLILTVVAILFISSALHETA